MAEEDPVLKVRIVYVLPDESPIEKISREGSEGATFGSRPGAGGNEAIRQRMIRAQESPLDQGLSRAALGGSLSQEGQSAVARVMQFSRVNDWVQGHARYVERWEDRNEARYSRSEDVAAFTAFRQGEREEERQEGLLRRHVIKGYKRSFRDWNRQQSREDRNEARYSRNKDMADFQKFREEEAEAEAENAPPRGVQFGPGGGPSAAYNRERAEEQLNNSSWSRRNLPTFRKFLGLNDKGSGMSAFYRRFLINEAIRSAGQVAEIISEHAEGIANTGGNPLALANFQLGESRNFANAIPFVGAPAFAIANSIAGTSTAVGRANLALAGEQAGASRLALSGTRLGLTQDAAVAVTERGLKREYAGIEAELQKSLRSARDNETKESTLNTDAANRQKADIAARHQGAGFVESLADDFGFFKGEYESVDANTAVGRRNASARRKKEEDDATKTASQKRFETWQDARAAVDRGNAEASQAMTQANQAFRPQGMEFFDPRVQAQIQAQQIGFTNSRLNLQQDLAYGDTIRTQGQGQADAMRPAQLQEREARGQQAITQIQAINANADREITSMKIGLTENSAGLKAALARDPAAGFEAQYQGSLARAGQLPADMQGKAAENARMQRDLSNSELKDRQLALGGSLALRESISGIQAQAFGPGADAMRRKAEIVGIAGGAENEAQGILRDRSLGTDAQRLSFADSARRTGINNLQAYAANYTAGFTSVETNRNNIAAGNKDSANPSDVFRSIDDGIRALKSNVGNGDITGAKGSLGGDSSNNLLQKILDALTNGALLATP